MSHDPDTRPYSHLALAYETLNDNPDFPVVKILVDGVEVFVDALPDWAGFGPREILGDESPLLPDDLGRRVAIYRCSCGIEGCGVVAPWIDASPDGRTVTWTDFRDYVGVFVGPSEPSAADYEGKPWNFADIRFDREQYVTEIRRASADDSWETPRRKVGRLVTARLTEMEAAIDPELKFRWASPASGKSGLQLSFSNRPVNPEQFRQTVLEVSSAFGDPEEAARDIVNQLLSIDPSEWAERFPWNDPWRTD